MYSVFFAYMVLIINILVVPLKASEQIDKRSADDIGSHPSGLDPLMPYPKANPHSSSHSIPPRRRNTRRDGKSCQQSSNNLNPLRSPSDLANHPTEGPNLPFFRTPFADSDERYCPMFQYVVCDSGVDKERVLRVATGKWRLNNCNRCKWNDFFFPFLTVCIFLFYCKINSLGSLSTSSVGTLSSSEPLMLRYLFSLFQSLCLDTKLPPLMLSAGYGTFSQFIHHLFWSALALVLPGLLQPRHCTWVLLL